MNIFVEGLQGSGKSTLVQRLSEKYPEYTVFREGDYSPVELSWCAYVTEAQYREILGRYSEIRELIEEHTYREGERRIVCYTRILTDIPGFHKDLEQYEIYNNRTSWGEFRSIIKERFRKWKEDRPRQDMIFECSLFQNIVEDMILFRQASDEEILSFYREIRNILEGKEIRILYLQTEDIKGSLAVIRKERSDEQGNELWYPLMCRFFNESPYAKARGITAESEKEGLAAHLRHRQDLELRICRELFPDKTTILTSKKYGEHDL